MENEIREIAPKQPKGIPGSQMKYLMILGFCAGALVIISLITAIFAMKSSRDAQNKVDVLTQEIEAAQNAMNDLGVRYENLAVSNQELTDELETLKESHEALKTQYDTLKAAYQELEEAYNSLVEENNQLKTDVEAAELEQEVKAFEKELLGVYRPESVMGMSMRMANIVYKIRGGSGDLEELYAVELQSDGQGIFLNEGVEVPIKWTLDGNELTLINGDLTSEAVYQSGRITMTVQDMEVILAKEE